MTVLWWLLSRGTARGIDESLARPGEEEREGNWNKKWIDGSFWRVLISLYVISFGMLAYAYLR